jgi:hypothetical protein
VSKSKRSPCIGWLCLLVLAGCGEPDRLDGRTEPAESTRSEALPDTHWQMIALLKDVENRTSEENMYIGDGKVRLLRARLARFPQDTPAQQRFKTLFDLGMGELAMGNEAAAIERLGEAYEMVDEARRAGVPERLALAIVFRLGVAHMRLGETQNCCHRNTPESCILPIRGGGIHTNREGSRQAIKYFMQVLREAEPTSMEYLDALWLLNVAHMTLDSYPDDVPEAYRLPPAVLESEEDFPRFPNIASRLGLDTFSLSGGAIGDDFDNDDDLDIVVSTWNTSGQIRYFVNNGDGSFSERTRQAGLIGILGGLNIIHADYDNDGDVDVLVLRGAWLFENGRYPNSLLRNNGDGTFRDVTIAAGLAGVHYPTQTASWGDYDNDGDLDLFIGNESTPRLEAPSQLFRNNGDGTFTDVAEQAGVTNLRWAKSVMWGDYDGDRFPDLYVSNLSHAMWLTDEEQGRSSGLNRLYHNNGDGTFTDVAEQAGVTEPTASFPSWFWDVDNDGALDLLVNAYAAPVGMIAASHLDLPVDRRVLPRLYRGDGRGGFGEVSAQWNLVRPTAPMGSNFGDLDNDGYLDFYLGTGDPDYKNLMPNVLYHNQDGRRFADITVASGFGHLQKGHGVVFADFDHDGDQDVFEELGGAYLGDKFNDAFYENPGFGNHWITVRLVGVRSNRSGIGARIRVDIVEQGRPRAIYKHVNSGATFGGNPMRQMIGLGKAERIERLDVFWPTTGETQIFADVPLDRAIQIVEGESSYEEIPLRTFRLGQSPPGGES